MKIKLIKTGEVKTVNDSYGLRMVEQGKAVCVPAKKAAAKPAPEKGDAAK